MKDSSKSLLPSRHFYDKDVVKLIFDFDKLASQVKQVYNDNNKKQNAACWELKCKDSMEGDRDEVYFEMAADN